MTANNTSIEFSYSTILQKHTIRTNGIELKGRGIKQHHSEKNGPFNVYSVTQKAFDKVCEQYPEMKFHE